jgi:bifunctional UDP-N-acetylglucosamine pyrophosphorylase / glucosamine-1-phosphate N-acetyltransferase
MHTGRPRRDSLTARGGSGFRGGRQLIIPAAGRGTRLGGNLPKVLVPVNGTSMLRRVLDLHAPWVDGAVVVARPDEADAVGACASATGIPAEIVLQETPTGMLDAILIGAAAARAHEPRRVWITWGDQIAVQAATLYRLAAIERGSALALPTVTQQNPYIHLERDARGRVARVLQRREGDEMPPAGESDVGVFSLSARACFDDLPRYAAEVTPALVTGERNFLPFIAWMAARDPVVTCPCTDPREAIGVNTPEDLAAVAAYLASR